MLNQAPAGLEPPHDKAIDLQVMMVFCTCPSAEIGQTIAKRMVATKLAACVNIISGVTSVYNWEGKTETTQEVLLLLKTTRHNYPQLEKALIDLHPYECPEVLGVPIEHGYKGYLQWLNNSVSL